MLHCCLCRQLERQGHRRSRGYFTTESEERWRDSQVREISQPAELEKSSQFLHPPTGTRIFWNLHLGTSDLQNSEALYSYWCFVLSVWCNCTSVYSLTQTWKPEEKVGYSILPLSIFSWDKEQEQSLQLGDLEASVIPLSPVPQLWDYRHWHSHAKLFPWVLGLWTQVLNLCMLSTITHWAISSASTLLF